ncbi:MAG: hypothetical protein H7246_09820 [Phycisphaerae bacterium]|nr:hypothetical protein [Saprospiraceae bacterium]
MKNLYYVLLPALGVLMSLETTAQNLHRLVVKADMAEAAKKQLGAALEWRFNAKNSLELQLGFRRHNELPTDVFNGDWTADYAKRRGYISSAASPPPANDAGWEYLGTGRPLPDAHSSIIPLSTRYARVAYGMSYQNRPQGLRIILLPGISFSNHRYFEQYDQFAKKSGKFESWQIGSNPNQGQYVEQTFFYTQTRQMREINWWVLGATHSFGFAWQAKPGFYLEARITAGVNFGDAPYSKQDLPNIMANYYGQMAFFLGWAF